MPELLALAQRIAAQARSDEQVEAYVAWSRETDVRIYEGDVESLSSAETAGIGIRVVKDSRQGFSYVGDLDEGRAREALEEARDNASFATPDEHVGLAEPDGVLPAVLELWHGALADYPTADKIARASELERLVLSADSRIRKVISTDWGDGLSETAIASSTGIAAESRDTGCYLSVEAVAGEGDETQTGSSYTVGRDQLELDPELAARDAVLRATRLLGARKPRSSRLTVVLDRRVTATLLSVLAHTLSGEEVAKGRSLFADRLGEEVAIGEITLVDDPTDPAAYGASMVDAEGLACRRNSLIEGGRLVGFLYDTYSGRLAGRSSTASAVRGGFKSTPGVGARALSLVPGELDLDQILGRVANGLFVQSISGVHSGVNRVSGDFSVGAEGLLIRDGVLAEPVREITIASTIQRMLQHVLHIGSDVERLPSSAMGMTLAIEDLAMSGE
jgi:PmbA protein